MPKIQKSSITILLASFNGAEFISEQLNSLIKQSLLPSRVVIRDDGSYDETVLIAKQFVNMVSFPIEIINNYSNHRGHLYNFSALCEYALSLESEYFCFSDQDDIWHKDKVRLLLERMSCLEKKYGENTPILIHSDLKVVDSSLTEIESSFVKFQGLPNPEVHDFPEFLYQNVVTGCACMFNKALLKIATPIPKSALVHDWWFALCAQYYGVVDYIDEPLVHYRQHDDNAIGATAAVEQRNFFKFNIYKTLMKFPFHLSQAIEQANVLLKIESKRGGAAKQSQAVVKEFSSLKQLNIFRRIAFVNRNFKGNRTLIELLYLYMVFSIVKWL